MKELLPSEIEALIAAGWTPPPTAPLGAELSRGDLVQFTSQPWGLYLVVEVDADDPVHPVRLADTLADVRWSMWGGLSPDNGYKVVGSIAPELLP